MRDAARSPGPFGGRAPVLRGRCAPSGRRPPQIVDAFPEYARHEDGILRIVTTAQSFFDYPGGQVEEFLGTARPEVAEKQSGTSNCEERNSRTSSWH